MNSNFRLYLLSLSLLVGVVVSLAVVAKAPISNVGSDSVQDLVTQLEHISNNRSVLLTQIQQHLSDLQRDIDALRGQIQENQYQLKKVVWEQQRILRQTENLNGQTSKSPSTSVLANGIAGARTDKGFASAATGFGDENGDYSAAVSLSLEKKQYDQAITAFQNFVKKYPQSTYQPNANYWLGQLYYSKGKKDDAAYYYAVVVKNYPKSPKSSDSMLKVGVIMQEKNQTDKARAVYQQVIKLYPDTDASIQAKKRLAGF